MDYEVLVSNVIIAQNAAKKEINLLSDIIKNIKKKRSNIVNNMLKRTELNAYNIITNMVSSIEKLYKVVLGLFGTICSKDVIILKSEIINITVDEELRSNLGILRIFSIM